MKFLYFATVLILLSSQNLEAKAASVELNCPAPEYIKCSKDHGVKRYEGLYSCSAKGMDMEAFWVSDQVFKGVPFQFKIEGLDGTCEGGSCNIKGCKYDFYYKETEAIVHGTVTLLPDLKGAKLSKCTAPKLNEVWMTCSH